MFNPLAQVHEGAVPSDCGCQLVVGQGCGQDCEEVTEDQGIQFCGPAGARETILGVFTETNLKVAGQASNLLVTEKVAFVA